MPGGGRRPVTPSVRWCGRGAPPRRATVCTCSPRCSPPRDSGASRGRRGPDPADIRRALRVGREGNLVVFVVDASGSMAARDRMAAVTGAALSLLRDAYQRRDKVAVITFRGPGARLVLPPTTSAHIAARRLTGLDTGGTTPLAEGLLAARDVVVRERARDRSRRPLVVVLTDGRATGRTGSVAAQPYCRRQTGRRGCCRGGRRLRDRLCQAGAGRRSRHPPAGTGAAAGAAARRWSGAGCARGRLTAERATNEERGARCRRADRPSFPTTG